MGFQTTLVTRPVESQIEARVYIAHGAPAVSPLNLTTGGATGVGGLGVRTPLFENMGLVIRPKCMEIVWAGVEEELRT